MTLSHRSTPGFIRLLHPVFWGFVATYLVSALIAAFVPFPDRHTIIRQGPHGASDWLLIARLSTPLSTRYQSLLMPRAMHYSPVDATENIPTWASLPAPPPPSPSSPAGHYEIADGFGWPCIALCYRFHGTGSGATLSGVIAGGIPLSPRATGAWYSPRALPFIPVWPGLLVNGIIAASAVTVIAAFCRALCRRHRRLRNRCMNCGYSLRTLTSHANQSPICPECGRA